MGSRFDPPQATSIQSGDRRFRLGLGAAALRPVGGQAMVGMSVYLYGNNATGSVERDEPAWQRWMSERFPTPQRG